MTGSDDDPESGRSRCGRGRRQGDDGETCKLPAGWGTEHVGEGACKLHGGASTGPIDTSETRMNGMTHGATAAPSKARRTFDEDEEALANALVEGWIRFAPFGPDSPHVQRLEATAVRAVLESRGLDHVSGEIAPEQVVGVSDDGTPVTQRDEHYLAGFCSRLSKEIRLTLDALGCLPSPDMAQAHATANLADALGALSTSTDESRESDRSEVRVEDDS